MKNKLLAILTFVLILGLQGFATPPPVELNQSTEQAIIYASPYSITDYSYWTIDSYISEQWTSAVYSGLFIRSGSTHEWIPDLAADYPNIAVNGTEFTVSLKSGLLFPSGNPITADDVIFSFEVALTPEINLYSYQLISQYLSKSSLIKIDNSTVKFVFNKPYAFALTLLASPIIEKGIFETRYNDCITGNSTACTWNDPTGADAKGAGPFMVDTIDTVNDIVTVVKNPNYWNTSNVKIDKIIFQMIPDKTTAVSALMAGEIDILDYSYLPTADEFDGYSNIHNEIIGGFEHHEMSLNHKSPYWGDGSAVPDGNASDDAMDALLIRRAMSHIIDRNYIADTIMGGQAVPATSTMPPSSVGWDSNLQADEYNITLAKELMTQAGFDYSTLTDNDSDGVYETFFFEVTLLSPNTNPSRNQWVSLIAEDLPKIGIGVKQSVSTGWGSIIPRTFGASSPPDLYDQGGYDIFFVSYTWGLDWDPSGLYEESNFLPTGGNFYNYINHTLEQLIQDYLSETNVTTRIEKAHAVQKALHDDLPVIPIINPAYHWAWNANISGLDAVLLSATNQNWGSVYRTDGGRAITSSTPTSTSTPNTTVTSTTSNATTTVSSSTSSTTGPTTNPINSSTTTPVTSNSTTPVPSSPTPSNKTTTTTTDNSSSSLTSSISPTSNSTPSGPVIGFGFGMALSAMALLLISIRKRKRN